MSNNLRFFEMASMSEASYADFVENEILLTGRDDVIRILRGKGWSETQAKEFEKNYRVISQQPNTSAGYSGTLFERLDERGVPPRVNTSSPSVALNLSFKQVLVRRLGLTLRLTLVTWWPMAWPGLKLSIGASTGKS